MKKNAPTKLTLIAFKLNNERIYIFVNSNLSHKQTLISHFRWIIVYESYVLTHISNGNVLCARGRWIFQFAHVFRWTTRQTQFLHSFSCNIEVLFSFPSRCFQFAFTQFLYFACFAKPTISFTRKIHEPRNSGCVCVCVCILKTNAQHPKTRLTTMTILHYRERQKACAHLFKRNELCILIISQMKWQLKK